MYLVCNQFGLFITTDSPDQPFGNAVPLEFRIKLCEDTFGMGFNKSSIQARLRQLQVSYGGLNFKGSRVVFVNGQIDPW
jgi:serine protease 16